MCECCEKCKQNEKTNTLLMEKFAEILEEARQSGKIRLLGEMNGMPGFEDFKAVTETVKMKFKAINAIGKYAILTDKNWLERLIPLSDFLTPRIPLKHFPTGDRDKAIAWLESDSD